MLQWLDFWKWNDFRSRRSINTLKHFIIIMNYIKQEVFPGKNQVLLPPAGQLKRSFKATFPEQVIPDKLIGCLMITWSSSCSQIKNLLMEFTELVCSVAENWTNQKTAGSFKQVISRHTTPTLGSLSWSIITLNMFSAGSRLVWALQYSSELISWGPVARFTRPCALRSVRWTVGCRGPFMRVQRSTKKHVCVCAAVDQCDQRSCSYQWPVQV